MSDSLDEPSDSMARYQAEVPPSAPTTPATGEKEGSPWQSSEMMVGIVLVLFLTLLNFWPRCCQVTLTTLGVYSWYYGPDVVSQAQSYTELKKDNSDQGEKADRLQIARLAQERLALWAMVMATPLYVGSVTLLLFLLGGARPRQFGLTTQRLGLNLLFGIGVWLVVTPVVLGLHQLVQSFYQAAFQKVPAEHPLTQIAQQGGLTSWEWFLWVSAVVVTAPITEELLFRGVLQSWLSYQRRGPEGAIGLAFVLTILMRAEVIRAAWSQGMVVKAESLSPLLFVLILLAGLPLVRRWRPEMAAVWGMSTLFALFHTGVWPTPVPLFVLGLALGELFRRTGSLVGPMLVHSLFNGASVVLYFLGLSSSS